MSRDTLSDVLRAVRLRGAVFYYIKGSSPWVAEAPPAREIIPGIMPGVEHMLEFHGVVEGSCWAGLIGEASVQLHAGDVILFPQGDAHTIGSAPGMRAPKVEKEIYFAPRPPQLPYALTLQDTATETMRLDGGGETTRRSCAVSSASTRARSTRSSLPFRGSSTSRGGRSAPTPGSRRS